MSNFFHAAKARHDYSSLDGAAALKAMIEAAWAARGGLTPYVWVEPCFGGATHVIVSDMLNGMPRQTGAGKASAGRLFSPTKRVRGQP